ncbi:MAG TPA: hypothetical protein DDY49_10215 [Paenibacillaceae bacterium]|nr:hypothetical protein [Paenibacillaceae bacterium]
MLDNIAIAIQAIVALTVLFTITRISGKKQLSQLNFFEYIVGITIGDLAAYVSTDLEVNLIHGYTSLFIWAGIPLLFEYLTQKSKKLRDLVDGKGSVIIRDGKIMEDNLRKSRFTSDELLQQLRLKNAFKVSDVEFAVLETNGKLSVLFKKENEKEPQTVIMDGNILYEPLAKIGLNKNWLLTELEKQGVTVNNVFLGQVDSYGELYVDLYDDKITPVQPTEKQLLLATLKKCQADLELYGLQTHCETTKTMYAASSLEMRDFLINITPYLR